MRIVLSRIAGLVGLTALAAACSPSYHAAAITANTKTALSLTCTATDVVMTMDPPTIVFDHTDSSHKPSDVDWTVANGSDDVDFTLTPKDLTNWPFEGTPPFKANKKGLFHGKGKASQPAGTHHYSISATCPNGLKVTFDPDIVVD